MNKERYLADMVKRIDHQNLCNLDFSWASVKHVSEKDIETTNASRPSDLVSSKYLSFFMCASVLSIKFVLSCEL
jgi:hypothetical protein